MVVVSWSAPELPSLLQWTVGSVGLVMGLLWSARSGFRQDVIANKFCVGYALARPRALDSGLTSGRVVGLYASEISACIHR